MLSPLFCLLSLLCLFPSVLSQAPNPPPVWPVSFYAKFGLYDDPILQPKIVNDTSYFYYNIDVPAQLIVYPDRCPATPVLINGSEKGCQLLFLEKGIFFTQPDYNIDCCMLFPNVGPIPRNFTTGFSWQGVDTANDYFGNQHTCDHYESPSSLFTFKYWTEVATHHDVYFHDGAGSNWAWDRLNVTVVDPSVFELFSDPQTCSQSCGLSLGLNRDEEKEMKKEWTKHSLVQLALHHHALKHKIEDIEQLL